MFVLFSLHKTNVLIPSGGFGLPACFMNLRPLRPLVVGSLFGHRGAQKGNRLRGQNIKKKLHFGFEPRQIIEFSYEPKTIS